MLLKKVFSQKINLIILVILISFNIIFSASFMALFNEGKYEEALPLCIEEAEDNNSSAMDLLGEMHIKGLGVSKNVKLGIAWKEKASWLGNHFAEYSLGELYKNGQEVPKNLKKALYWHQKSAKNGNYLAQYQYGLNFYKGKVVPKDDSIALYWLEKSAKKNYVKAMSLLGTILSNSNQITRNYVAAAKWYQKAIKQKDPLAENALGIMYTNGQGVEKDYKKASTLFRSAAEKNSSLAQLNLGLMYYKGLGVIQSNKAAIDWIYKAGISFLKKDDTEKALICLDKIISIDPKHFLAAKLNNKIYSTKNKKDLLSGKSSGSLSTGTGWATIHGIIVTNYHVVKDASNIIIYKENGENSTVKLLQYDAANDIAILKPKDNNIITTGLEPSKSKLKLGHSIFTIGYPHPDIMGISAKFSSGEVSSTKGAGDDPRYYQITVPLQLGNSGGPLVNSKGECVGIITSKLNALNVLEETGDLLQNVNYALKVNYLIPLLDDLQVNRKIANVSNQNTNDIAAKVKDAVFLILAE